MADFDDDEGGEGGLYEFGHWIWDDNNNQLVFIGDRTEETIEVIQMPTKAPTGAVEFRDDVDLIEQLRYRRRYQRKLKPGQPDIVTVQDCKDIALYTAPISILSASLINMLHLPTTERFIKALILFCQYYLQISDEMVRRIMDLESKIRTPICDVVESEFAENLNDLRVLVAKEYCTMLMGGADTRKYHHMGPLKKRRSLSDKDARFFETLLRMCVQIVWLALGRKSFNQIELEVNRLFKSEIFNAVEHNLKTNYLEKMSKEERKVLIGPCARIGKKLTTRSPLLDETFCARQIDFRLMGIGVIKNENLSDRHIHFRNILARPEEEYTSLGISLGIVGLERSIFDTMLKPVPTCPPVGSTKSSKKSIASVSRSISESKKSLTQRSVYANIFIPVKSTYEDPLPPGFPSQPDVPLHCNEVQRARWLQRLKKLTRLHSGKRT